MVERRKRKPLVLSSTKALVDSLLNSHRTTEERDEIDEIDSTPTRTPQFTAGILRVSDDARADSFDVSVLVGLPTAVLKQLSITSGSMILVNNGDANVSRIGQAVVIDPPNPDDSFEENESLMSHPPKTMLIFPSYGYPRTQHETLDHQVAYISPILAFNLNLHLSCLKAIVQLGKVKLPSLFGVKGDDETNEKENEHFSVRIGLEPWAEMPKYASHLRASFVKIPECGTLGRLKSSSFEEAKDRQGLIDLALNDYFSVDRYLARGDLFSVSVKWNCKSELCISCNQKMKHNILQGCSYGTIRGARFKGQSPSNCSCSWRRGSICHPAGSFDSTAEKCLSVTRRCCDGSSLHTCTNLMPISIVVKIQGLHHITWCCRFWKEDCDKICCSSIGFACSGI